MLRPIIYAYKLQSKSAKALSESLSDLRCKRVRENGNYSYHDNHVVINWGNPRYPNWWNQNNYIVNIPQFVKDAQNKHKSFVVMLGNVRIPKFTDEIRPNELVDLIEAFAEEQSKDYFNYRFNGGESTYKKWRKKQNQSANSKLN